MARFRVVVLLLPWLWGCLSDELRGPLPVSLEKVAASDQQQATAGGRLDAPLQVIVRAEDGSTVSRGQVRWSIVAGAGAALSDSLTVADGTGVALIELTLGPEPGTYEVMAALEHDASRAVTFTAEATPPPSLTSVSPAVFSGGDTVALMGANLSERTRFEVDEAVAPLVSGSLSASGVSLVVPPCLSPGAVSIRAFDGEVGSNSVAGTYQTSTDPVSMAVGDYVSVRPEEIEGCAVFPTAGAGGAEYLIAPQSVTAAHDSTSYRLRGDPVMSPVGQPVLVPAKRSWAAQFHDLLRAQEQFLADAIRRPPERDVALSVAQAQLIKVGSRRDFAVCSDISCGTIDVFETVTAEAVYVGRHAAIFQDIGVPAGGFTEDDFQVLGSMFDEQLYEVATQAFGSESDIDTNGLLLVLLTPVVNGLTPKSQCSSSFITGFFFPLDLSTSAVRDERSNQAEIFYAVVPDPNGTVTCDFSKDVIQRTVPVTFVHEIQHMISFHQHVLLRGGHTEILWLNEGMSHLSEELAALRFRVLGDQPNFSRFAVGNLLNAFQYLENPGAAFALASEGSGTLIERGSAWLFLRWLIDRHGDHITRRLSETNLTGVANVEAATGVAISKLLAEWFLANYVSDLPDFEAAPQLQYETWAFRTTYGSLHEQSPELFNAPFPLVPEVFLGGNLDRSGVLRAGSGEYFIVRQLSDDPGFALSFTGQSGAPLTDVAAPRLNIIRIK